jgi:hypothetical protein
LAHAYSCGMGRRMTKLYLASALVLAFAAGCAGSSQPAANSSAPATATATATTAAAPAVEAAAEEAAK